MRITAEAKTATRERIIKAAWAAMSRTVCSGAAMRWYRGASGIAMADVSMILRVPGQDSTEA